MGLTTVHEVGHWLGLADIYKVKPLWGTEEDFSKARAACLKLDGTCDTQVECLNYMSYASDKCKNEFNPEQIRFMKTYAKEMLAGGTPQPIEIDL
ncbi:2OG-Fe(II) oxygenase [Metarhizium guizhouense ARSEF 977]|uniref:2OG-Fe(II) oxygenase n=1 Tax=Metarhizium guizhouense (strain ARSEF 977) TaxID=1276136 RepID=A0A0B4G7V9_METGA|nr:2OG-Fe(II) oxygenase [Metarhizium guizhouense ARSEF 977]